MSVIDSRTRVADLRTSKIPILFIPNAYVLERQLLGLTKNFNYTLCIISRSDLPVTYQSYRPILIFPDIFQILTFAECSNAKVVQLNIQPINISFQHYTLLW